jgi:RNA polymerase sigma-B factor
LRHSTDPGSDVRPRSAASDGRRNGAGDDRLARTLKERRLFGRYRASGDRAARDALVEQFLPLATRLARRYQRGAEPLEDLVQVASVGLLKAIDRFDAARGTAFSSFAVPTIAGELKRHFRDKGWSVRVPRDVQELAVRLDRATDRLVHELGHAPTASEIADDLGVTIEQVLEAREAAAAYRADSLDRPGSDDGQDGRRVLDTLGGDEPGYRRAEDSATLGRIMSAVGDREREILRLRFAEDLTQSEIGDRVGLSQMHVSRLLRQAVARLREAAESSDEPARSSR